MSTACISFTSTHNYEAIPATARQSQIDEFLAGTGYTFTKQTGMLAGILHRGNEEPASAGRRMVKQGDFLVKQDNVLIAPVSAAWLTKMGVKL